MFAHRIVLGLSLAVATAVASVPREVEAQTGDRAALEKKVEAEVASALNEARLSMREAPSRAEKDLRVLAEMVQKIPGVGAGTRTRLLDEINAEIRAAARISASGKAIVQQKENRDGDKVTFAIKLSVSAKDAERNQVASYLSRELRQVGDVRVTDGEHAFELCVIVLPIRGGFAGSVCVQQPYPKAFVDAILDGARPSAKAYFDNLVNDRSLQFPPRHSLLTDPDLENLCKRMVAELDQGVLEPVRRLADEPASIKEE